MATQLSSKQKITQVFAQIKEKKGASGKTSVSVCRDLGLIPPKEAAGLIGCHTRMLRELTEKGMNGIQIPATDTGLKTTSRTGNPKTVWGYKEEDILEALEKILASLNKE